MITHTPAKTQAAPSDPYGHRQRLYPEVSDAQWNDWSWQMQHRITRLEQAEKLLTLTDAERQGLQQANAAGLPFALTPYYAGLLDPEDPEQGLRRTKMPVPDEGIAGPGERDDPLGEEAHRPVPGIIHTYPDKVLFLVSDFCATYCRYCTRARMVGTGELPARQTVWDEALHDVRSHPGIRDVLISGGDPLLLSDRRLAGLLAALRAIPHVEIIRIGTKVPAVLPQRITQSLVEALQPFHPVYLSIHFIHPDELTPEVHRACSLLADHGFPLGGQSVLLKGVNDRVETMKALNQGLLKMRVKPYYLHQCDPVTGSARFRTPVQTGLDILEALHGHTTGYAIPHYMIDAPGGGGKVPVHPHYVLGRDGDDLLLKNFQGDTYRYYDPIA